MTPQHSEGHETMTTEQILKGVLAHRTFNTRRDALEECILTLKTLPWIDQQYTIYHIAELNKKDEKAYETEQAFLKANKRLGKLVHPTQVAPDKGGK